MLCLTSLIGVAHIKMNSCLGEKVGCKGEEGEGETLWVCVLKLLKCLV